MEILVGAAVRRFESRVLSEEDVCAVGDPDVIITRLRNN
jgi:hypothetical protein